MKKGAGTLILEGVANIYTGGTTVQGGLIEFAALGSFGSGAITLNGGGLRWATGNTADVSGRLTALGAGGATFDTNGNDVSFASALSGAGGITKAGAGTLTLTAANTYSGATSITGGTLVASGGLALPDSTDVTVASGATFRVADGEVIGLLSGAGTVQIDAGAILIAGRDGADSVFSGVMTGGGSFEKDNTGTLTLSGEGSDIGGDLTVCCGTLVISGGLTAQAGTLVSEGILSVTGTLATDDLTVLETMEVDGPGASVTIGGMTSVFSGQTVGSLTISNGAHVASNGAALIAGAPGDPGSSVFITGAFSTWEVTDALNIGGGAGFGAGAVIVADGGMLLASSGIVIESNGLLRIGIGGPFGSAGSVTAPSIANDGTIEANFFDTATLSSVISGEGSLTKSGSGTLILSGANTYSGQTVVSGGVLNIRNESALGGGAGGTVVESGAALELEGTLLSLNEAITLSGTGVANGGALRIVSGWHAIDGAINLAADTRITNDGLTLNLYGAITGAHGLTIGGSGTTNYYGVTSQATSLTKDGSGILYLHRALSPSGPTNINGGTLSVRSSTALGSQSIMVASGAMLELDGGISIASTPLTLNGTGITGSGALRSFSGSNSFAGPITLASTSRISSYGADSVLTLTGDITGAGFGLEVWGRDGDTVISGVIATGTGTLSKDGVGTLTLSAANTFTGATTISMGTIALTGAGSIADSASVFVNGTLDISGTTAGASINALSGTASGAVLALGSRTLTVNQTSAGSFAGGLTGSGTLVKQGAQTLTLTGDSGSFTGNFAVNAGTLIVSNELGTATGSLGGNVSVASGAALEGYGGSIGGTVTVADGGRLRNMPSLGNAGGLTMGELALGQGAIIDVGLHTPGTTSGIFSITGDLTLAGTLNITGLPGYGAGVYRVFEYGGELTDNGLTLGTPQVGGFLNTLDFGTSAVDVVTTSIDTSLQYWSADGTTRGGSGTWTGANPWINVSGGTSAWGGDTAIFDGTAGTVIVSGTQSFHTLEFLTTDYEVVGGRLDLGTGGRLWAEGQGVTAAISSVISGTGALTKIGAGAIMLTGDNTYQGGTVIQAGFLRISHDANLGDVSGALTFSGGALATSGTFTIARDVILTENGQFYVEDGSTLTLGGTISGPEGLVLHSGTLVLTGTNTYGAAAGTALLGGRLEVSSNANLGAASGILAFVGGTLATDTSFDSGRNVTISGPSVGYPGGGTFEVANTTTLGLSGVISGAGALTKTGDGTLRLSGANTHSGLVTISAGTLALSGAGSLASSSGVYLGEGTLDISATTAGASIARLTGPSGPTSGTVVLGEKTLTLTNASGTFGGIISGTGGLVVAGGTQTLSGANTYGGTTGIASGATLALTGNGSIVNSSGVTANGTLDISGTVFGANVSSLSGNGTVVLGTKELSFVNATGVFAGTITGSGSLAFWGGSQALAGNNTYSGGTTVNTGAKLVLGSNTAAGSGQISFANGSTLGLLGGLSIANDLAINGSVAVDLASGTATATGTLSGTGTITYGGDGKVILTGNSTAFAGTTHVDGTLAVNDRLGGSVNVRNGGTLMGTGTVGPVTIGAGGTIAPGNSIGTLNIAGPLTFDAASTYAVEIDTTGASDRIAVTGTAALNGATVSVTKAPGSYAYGTQYTILTATGGITGTFGALSQDLPFLNLDLSYTGTAVLLDVARNEVPLYAAAVTRNQFNTALAVDRLGFGNPVYEAVVGQSTITARQAFNALDGEIYASASSVLQSEGLILRRAVLDRARAPVESAGPGPLAYGPGGPGLDSSYQPNAFWARGFGAWGRVAGDTNAAAISGDTAGVIVGYDRTFSGGGADWRFGFASGYSSSRYSVGGRSSSYSSDNAHVAVYGAADFGAVALRLGGAYSWADIDATRTVSFPGFYNRLSGDTTGRTGQVFGEAAYAVPLAGTLLEPFAGLAYVNVEMDGLTEQGGPAALTSFGSSQGVTYSTLGARVNLPVMMGGVNTAFRGTLAWQHAFGGLTPEATFGFATAPVPFAVTGTPIATDAALVEAGLDIAFTPATTFSASYVGQLSDRETSSMMQGSLTVRF
ncbi:autotransporter domain-containing protein [Xanthobacteraceae bacterium A53D]